MASCSVSGPAQYCGKLSRRQYQTTLLKRSSRQSQVRFVNFTGDVSQTLLRNPPPQHATGPLQLDWCAGFLQGRKNPFRIGIQSYSNARFGVAVVVDLHLSVSEHQLHVLVELWQLFGQVGTIYYSKSVSQRSGYWHYVVYAQDCFEKVVPFVDQMPLQGQKLQQYFMFRALVQSSSTSNLKRDQVTAYSLMMSVNEHILQLFKQKQKNQLLKINYRIKEKKHTEISKHMKRWAKQKGLSKEEASKWKYQVIQANQRFSNLTENFVTGMVDSTGCFQVGFRLATDRWPLFQIYFRGCIIHQQGAYQLKFTNLNDFADVVIPFFLKNPLRSGKYYDFERFTTVFYKYYYSKQYSVKLFEELVEIAYSGQRRLLSSLAFKKEMLVEYLNVAKSREQFHQVKPKLQEIKKQLKDKWSIKKVHKDKILEDIQNQFVEINGNGKSFDNATVFPQSEPNITIKTL